MEKQPTTPFPCPADGSLRAPMVGHGLVVGFLFFVVFFLPFFFLFHDSLGLRPRILIPETKRKEINIRENRVRKKVKKKMTNDTRMLSSLEGGLGSAIGLLFFWSQSLAGGHPSPSNDNIRRNTTRETSTGIHPSDVSLQGCVSVVVGLGWVRGFFLIFF